MSDTNIFTAIVDFQKEMPTVARETEGQAGQRRYKYADLTDIVKTITPVLVKHGLAFYCTPRHNTDTGQYETVGILAHVSGSTIEGTLPIFGRTPQEIGSSLTYNRRYLLANLTGIVTDEDDDGAAASRQAQPTRPQQHPMDTAREKVSWAWSQTHNGVFDAEAMAADYMQRYGTDVNTANVANLNTYAQTLMSVTAEEAVARSLGGTVIETQETPA